MSFTWNLAFPQTFLIINVLTGIITGCGCQESVNAIKTNWWKNWENYLTALIQLGWRLLKHSLCFPAPQEVLRHQRARALLRAARSAGPPRLHRPPRRTRLPELKHLLSWLQLEAFITAAHQPRERDVVHIYPTSYISPLSSPAQGSSTPPTIFHSAMTSTVGHQSRSNTGSL